MIDSFFSEREFVFIINLVVCLVAGFVIGMERESRGKAAGISTHIMVVVGAMLFTYLSMQVDPASKSRIAAQIVSGIGFLGAGLILKEGANVKNLTTASSIWVAGAIGMAVGFNFQIIALITTVTIALVPRIPHAYKKSPEAEETFIKEKTTKK